MVKEHKNLRRAIFIRDNMKEESLMAMENTIGRTAVTLKETLSKDCDMDTECGKKEQETAINMRVRIMLTKSMAMESSPGPPETSIKGIIVRICVQILAKCTGVTEVITKDSGRTEFSTEKVLVHLFRIIICSWVGYQKGQILK